MVKVTRGEVRKRTWIVCDEHGRPSKPCCRKAHTHSAWAWSLNVDGKQIRKQGFASQVEAQDALDAYRAEQLAPPVQQAVTITLNEYADRWLNSIVTSVEPRTVENYRGMLKNHIRPTLGDALLPSITRGQVKELLAAKRGAGLSKDTVRLIRAALSSLYADAMDTELVTANPAIRTGRDRGRKTPDSVTSTERRQKIRAMTIEQLAGFLKTSAGDRHGLLWLTLADTGMRPGEAFALRWDDLDLVDRKVLVERAVARGGRIKGTKTGSSRTVDLASRLTAALDRYQTTVEAEALAAGRDVPSLVFPSEAGTALDGINVARRFQAAVRRAGLPKFRLYDLRHSFASHLLAMGESITYVAAQLGHAKPTMTLAAYAHYLPSGDRSAADRLEAVRTRLSARRTSRPSRLSTPAAHEPVTNGTVLEKRA
jgi:integrase